MAALLPLALGRPNAAAAQGIPTIAITPKEVHDQYFIAKHLDSAKGPELVKSLVLENALHAMRKPGSNMANADLTQVVEQLKLLERELDERKSDWAKHQESLFELYGAALASLTESPLGPIAGPLDYDLRNLILDDAKRELDLDKRTYLASERAQDAFGPNGVLRRAGQIVQKSLDTTDPVVRQARDIVLGPMTGNRLSDSTRDIIDSSVALRTLEGVNALLDNTGAIRGEVILLRNEFKVEMGEIKGQIVEIRGRLDKLDKGQEEILTWIGKEEKRRQDEENNRIDAARAQLELDAKKAGVYLLSTFIGFADPKLGRQVAGVGNAAIQIGESLNKWSEAAASFQKVGDRVGEALTGAVMTGNIVGAIMSILPLFMDTGPTMDEMILDEVRSLQKQVDQLGTEMHGRFDRIDAALNGIWKTLDVEFGKVHRSLDEIRAGVRDLHSSLVELQADVDRFTLNVYELVSDQEGRRFWHEADRALGFKQRSGADLPYQPDYLGHESFFLTWATGNSFDSLATMPSNRSFADADVLAELGWPMEKNVNYLAALVARWGQPFATSKLPSALQWAIAARAYATLALEWPEHGARVSPDRIRAVEEVGQALQVSLRRISTVTTEAGPRGNRALFALLFANYRQKLHRLDVALAAVEGTYLADTQARGVDIFADSSQLVTQGSLPAFVPPCDLAEDAELATPSIVSTDSMVPPVATLAARLDVGGMGVCARTGWADKKRAPNGSQTARLQVEIRSAYQAAGSTEESAYRSYTLTLDRQTICDLDENCLSASAEAQTRWILDGLKAQFEADAVLTVNNAALPAAIAPVVDEDLRRRRGELYRKLESAFASDKAVRDAGHNLTGAKELLTQFIALGLSRALEESEFMHAFLYGGQRLLDEDGERRLSRAFRDATSQPTSNFRVSLGSTAEQRVRFLETLVNEYLDLIDQGKHVESNRLIRSALNRLAIARWLISQTPMPPASEPAPEQPAPPASGSGPAEPAILPATGRVADVRAPALRLTLARRQRLARVLAKGLVIFVRCSERCSLNGRGSLDRRLSRHLRIGAVVARGTAYGGPGRVRLTLRFKRATARKLRAFKRMKLTLNISGADAIGNTRYIKRAIVIRR